MSNGNFFSKFTPKQSFVMGIAAALAAFFVVGFFVLLGQNFGENGSEGRVAGSSRDVDYGNQPSAPSPSVPEEPTAGAIQIVPVSKDEHIRGNKNASISIIEFSDIQCPFCQRAHPTLKQLIEEYDGKVNWVYRHFPLDSIHPQARPAALASECVADLKGNEAFWAFLDKLFENQQSLGQALYEQMAGEVGVNINKFKECVSSQQFTQLVQEQYQQAINAGGRGTPYSVVVSGETKIPISGAVPIEDFKAAVNPLLE